MTRAYRRGAARARFLKRLDWHNVIGSAMNPYRRAASREQWNAGFCATYYAKPAQ